MKKFIAILALTMALCLTCGVVYAAGIDYSAPKFLQNNTIIHFENPSDTKEFKDFTFKADALEYDIDVAGINVTGKTLNIKGKVEIEVPVADSTAKVKGWIVGSGDCTVDSWIEVEPTNEAVLRNNNDADTINTKALKGTDTTEYAGYHADLKATKKITAAEVKNVNKALYEILKARDHKLDKVRVVKESTCTEQGEVVPVCSVCDKEGSATVTEANKHESYLSDIEAKALATEVVGQKVTKDGKEYTVTKASNCSANGTYEGPCKACGEKKVTFEIPAKNPVIHDFGEWQVEIAPTCTKPGLSYRLCKLCLKTKEYKKTDELGHDWAFDYIKVPTCKEAGFAKSATCSRCNKVLKKATWGDFADAEKKYGAAKTAIELDGENLKLKEDTTNHPKEYWKLDTTNAKYLAASCTKTGVDVYKCGLCGEVATTITSPAKGHKLVTVYAAKTDIADPDKWIKPEDFASCKEGADGKPIEFVTITYCETERVIKDGKPYGCNYPTKDEAKADATKWTAVKNADHTWGAWTVRNEPSDKTPGYWIRECTACHKHDEFIGNTAPTNATDPTKPTKNGLQLEEDGTVQLYVDGKKSDASGVYAYDGGRFIVINGKVDTSINGAVVTSATECLFFANGQVQESYTGLAEYNGQWFVVKAGKVDTAFNGLFAHDGGTFVVAAGRVVKELNGLWLAPDGEWYLISNGQVYWADAEVEYDGATFTVKGGKVVA